MTLYNGHHVWVFLHCCGFHTHESLLMLHMTAELSHLTCPVFKREAYLPLYLEMRHTLHSHQRGSLHRILDGEI